MTRIGSRENLHARATIYRCPIAPSHSPNGSFGKSSTRKLSEIDGRRAGEESKRGYIRGYSRTESRIVGVAAVHSPTLLTIPEQRRKFETDVFRVPVPAAVYRESRSVRTQSRALCRTIFHVRLRDGIKRDAISQLAESAELGTRSISRQGVERALATADRHESR
jgi:hypothetical protein